MGRACVAEPPRPVPEKPPERPVARKDLQMDVRLEKADLERLFEPGDDIMERPSREEAEAAVRTLLRWAGDNPNREGLRDTPKRVAKHTRNSSAAITKTRSPCWAAPSRKWKGTTTS